MASKPIVKARGERGAGMVFYPLAQETDYARRLRLRTRRLFQLLRSAFEAYGAQRQTSLGITSYRWQTALDERVRASHRARQGAVFDWAKPPDGGHPGEDINCRCVAQPIIPKDLDIFGEDK